MSDSFFADYFSSKELDSSLAVPKHQSHHAFNDSEDTEPKSERHSKDDTSIQERRSKIPQVMPPRPTKLRTKRAKREDSLEREIAKLILSEAHGTSDNNLEIHTAGALSPKDILSDLVLSHYTISYVSSQSKITKTNDKNECKKSEACYFDDSTAVGHFAEDNLDVLRPTELFSKTSFDSDAFDFNAYNNEWAVFDNCSIFGIEHKQTIELDGDGFPVSCEEKYGEEEGEAENFGMKLNLESTLAEEPVKIDKENEDDKKSEDVKTTEFSFPESVSIISCDDRNAQSESKTGLLSLSGGFKGNSYDFESKQSPSSVANFSTKKGCAGGLYAFKCKSTGVSKSPWSPKPPEHCKHSNIVLYRTGDTLI